MGTAGQVLGDREDRGRQRDDADAAADLFKEIYPKLAGWVRQQVDDDDTAHEIASEAFVRLLGRWTKVDRPQSYLYMIATSLMRDNGIAPPASPQLPPLGLTCANEARVIGLGSGP